MTESAEAESLGIYDAIEPVMPLGLPFASVTVNSSWSDWPSLPDLFPMSFPGVKTSRDSFVVDIDLDKLRARLQSYFDSGEAQRTGPDETGFVQFAYRPYDNRWLYWEAKGGLLDRPRPEYKPHIFNGNLWLSSAQHLRKGADEPQTWFTEHIGSLHLIERGANMFPAWLRDDGLVLEGGGERRRPNLSAAAQHYLDRLGMGVEDLFHHVLAVLHDPTYRKDNAGALRMEWPRIPLPGWPDSESPGAADELAVSAARGRELARLLDPQMPVPGVTTGDLRRELATIAVPATTKARNMVGDDFALTAGWGHLGTGDAVMPGQGRAVERPCTAAERAALDNAAAALSETTFDIYLNAQAHWRNVPATVWNYKLGGYQVLKKWLSYRESRVLGRPLLPEEVQHFTDTARRIGAIVLVAGKV